MSELALRIIKQLRNDRRSLALLIVAPLFVLSLIYLLLGPSDYVPLIVADEDTVPAAVIDTLKEQEVVVESASPTAVSSPKTWLEDHLEVDLIILAPNPQEGFETWVYESNTRSGAAREALATALANANANPNASITDHMLYSKEDGSLFDSLGFIFPGIFTFFFVFLIAGMALVRERSGGTLERLLMTPIRRWEVISGYTLGISFYGIIQATVIVCFTIYVLRLPCEGPVWLVVAAMLLLAITAVSFGALVSIFANTEFQIMKFIPIVIVPQVFFSGLIPLETIPYGLGKLSIIMPLYYGCTAMKEVMTYGASIGKVWPALAALAAYTLLLGILNTLALKKYRAV
jgi:ABC-2 type transport system permease protein